MKRVLWLLWQPFLFLLSLIIRVTEKSEPLLPIEARKDGWFFWLKDEVLSGHAVKFRFECQNRQCQISGARVECPSECPVCGSINLFVEKL